MDTCGADCADTASQEALMKAMRAPGSAWREGFIGYIHVHKNMYRGRREALVQKACLA